MSKSKYVYTGTIIDKHVLMNDYGKVRFVLILRDEDDDVTSDSDVPGNVFYSPKCRVGAKIQCNELESRLFEDNKYEYIFVGE